MIQFFAGVLAASLLMKIREYRQQRKLKPVCLVDMDAVVYSFATQRQLRRGIGLPYNPNL